MKIETLNSQMPSGLSGGNQSFSRSQTSKNLDNTYSIKVEDIRSLNNKLKFLSEENTRSMNEM